MTAEARPPDRSGRIFGMTWPVQLRRGGWLAAQILFGLARHLRWVTRPLCRLEVIRVAHWTILRDVPDGRGGRRKLPRPVLLFDASFDVDIRRYIEIFAEAIRWRFRAVWGRSVGYPGVIPPEAFRTWVEAQRTDAAHYYCAYEDATTRMVDSALRANDALERFHPLADPLDDNDFAEDFETLRDAVANDGYSTSRRMPGQILRDQGDTESFLVLVPIRPGHEAALEAAFGALGPPAPAARPRPSPLAAVPGTHAARLTILRGLGLPSTPGQRLPEALLCFSALVDGPLDAWLRAMAEMLGPVGDRFWSHCAGWDASDASGTARWLLAHRERLHTCVIGHPGVTVEQVTGALERHAHLEELASLARTLTPKKLRYCYDDMFGLQGADGR